MEKHIDILTVGTIDFNDILNEAEISSIGPRYRVKNIGPCKVEVYGDEGQIPHFHIVGISKKFNCCVRIYDNHFFSHGNKNRDTLNHQQCIELNKWLSEISANQILDSTTPSTNWKVIEFSWRLANPDCKFPDRLKVTEQPDYSKMSEFRDTI